MKKFGIIFFILIALFFAYLAWSYFAFPSPDTAAVRAGKALNNSGKSINGFQEDILSSGKKQIEAAKSFVAQIPEAAANAINDIVDQTKDTIREKLNPLLETTSSPAYQPVPLPISGNFGASSGTAQNLSTEPNVCSVISRGTAIGYGIDNPFLAGQETKYKIAWGDGEAVNGTFQSGEQNVVVSHSYAQQGTYSITFQVMSSSTTLTVSRSVCVKG